MKEASLRLRLVVRRHELPEVRLLFSIALHDGPTIANLLEQVNDTVPLESPDWGLDDYVVEVADPHGRAFECLHFHPVSTILDRDEEVIIRPLFTVDRKKRLLSGRHQISSDGKHLVDGVAFGRPRLKVPRGRPPVEIPPLKKRRIAFDQEEDNDEDEDDGEDDGEYQEGSGYGEDDEEQDLPLLLTEYGEEVDEPGAVRVAAIFDDEDADNDEEGLEEEDSYDEDEEDAVPEIDETELLDELRDIQMDNDILAEGDPSLEQEPEPAQQRPAATSETDPDLTRLNKITALRRAFPAVDCHIYEDVLQANHHNEERAYNVLRKSYEASMTLDQMRDLLASFFCPVIPSGDKLDAGAEDVESDAESTSSLVKRYDEHGFPSGSILDGSASKVAAEALRRAGHSVRSPVHTKFDDDNAVKVGSKQVEGSFTSSSKLRKDGRPRDSHEIALDEDDESDTSDSSSSDSDGDEQTSDDDGEVSFDGNVSDSDDDDASSEEEDSDDDDDANEDSGPEVAPTKPPVKSPASRSSVASAQDGSPSKKRKREPTVDERDDTGSHDSSSSDDSTDSSSESESSSSDESSEHNHQQQPASSSKQVLAKSPSTATAGTDTQSKSAIAPQQSAPGQGKIKTRLRNARRKAAKQALKAAAEASVAGSTPTAVEQVAERASQADDIEFEKRKQALLEQLAKRSAEASSVGLEGSSSVEHIGNGKDGLEEPSVPATRGQLPGPDITTSALESSSQRRSKLDVGAGRRMLFASLGIRNPKTKADEEKIRGVLMKGVKPLTNHRIAEPSPIENGNTAQAKQGEQPESDDPEAWRSRIVYRAVECCQEGVELSEPPFPFVQRWDPQQQNTWKDKRGGKGKRKQRNQSAFYEDDSTLPSTKKQRLDAIEAESSFAAQADNGQDQGVALNYDDIPDSMQDRATADHNVSQLTDVDDLPPLPNDLATLSALEFSEAKPGMVITWKQMLVSKATNWAPQVLNLTAVIVSVDEATEGLRLVLARRDRNLDGNEKTYDEDGNRVYDRFDAPDDDDEEGGNSTEGYRTVPYSDMMEPRIVQQPLPSLQNTALHRIVESQDRADIFMAGFEGPANHALEKGAAIDAADDSTTLSNQQESTKDHDDVRQAGATCHHDLPDQGSYGSIIPDSVPMVTTDGSVNMVAEDFSRGVRDVSMSEDRQQDIDDLIHEAGFRAEVTPSVLREAHFSIDELSSPSRQLEEMSEAAAASNQGSVSPALAQSLRVPNTLQQIDAATDESPTVADRQATAEANTARDVLPVRASAASSIRSGRQPDKDISMNWGEDDLVHNSGEPGEDLPEAESTHMESNGQGITPTKPKALLMDNSDRPSDSSPLPSLEELFCTASQSRSTQSPVMARSTAAIKLQKPETKRDLEYEEVIRRVDNPDGSEEEQEDLKKKSSIPHAPGSIEWEQEEGFTKEEKRSHAVAHSNASKNGIAKPGTSPKSQLQSAQSEQSELKQDLKQEPSTFRSISPPSMRKRRPTHKIGNFSIPKGSQVVSFLTSGPEPDTEEHYAEDSIDSTNEASEPMLPGKSRRTKRTQAGKGKQASGAASLTALSAARAKQPNGGSKQLAPSPGKKGGRGPRKASAKF